SSPGTGPGGEGPRPSCPIFGETDSQGIVLQPVDAPQNFPWFLRTDVEEGIVNPPGIFGRIDSKPAFLGPSKVYSRQEDIPLETNPSASWPECRLPARSDGGHPPSTLQTRLFLLGRLQPGVEEDFRSLRGGNGDLLGCGSWEPSQGQGKQKGDTGYHGMSPVNLGGARYRTLSVAYW